MNIQFTPMFNKAISLHIIYILSIAALMAVVANSFHPKKVEWVKDWSHHIEARAAARNIDVIPFSAAVNLLNSAAYCFIDARHSQAYEKGHIPTAISLPFHEFDDRFEEVIAILDDPHPIVVYCSSCECDDSLLLAENLQDMGHSNIVLFVDGFDLWKEAGGLIEESQIGGDDASR